MNSDALSKRERGETNQTRFYRLLSDTDKVPTWVTGILPTSPKSDSDKGIDFYVFADDFQVIPVDVKSSSRGRKNTLNLNRRLGRDICLIVMEDKLDDDRMLAEIVMDLEQWKQSRPLS